MQEKSSQNSQSALRKQAADLLTSSLASGDDLAAESTLTAFPLLAKDRESVLELIYLEWILRNEHGKPCSLDQFAQRFPDYQPDLEKLLEVDEAMRVALADEASSLSSRDSFGASSLDTWSDRANSSPASSSQIGDYALQGIVGRGGMGIVYRAKQCRLDRLVALKTIDLIGSLNPQSVARFREEAELVARLQHPNIVQVFETGSHNGIPYFSMEYVDGGNLAAWMRDRAIKPVQSAKLVEVLARAIHYAHLEGIIHRDLKPANVLLARSNRSESLDLGQTTSDETSKIRFEPKIVDFGLAKLLGNTSRQTITGTAIGTPSYMSPEQLDADLGAMGPASDVYSLGAILFELLAGEPPFHGPTALETMQMVRTEEPVFPKSLRQRVSGDLILICQTCLRKEPNQRYASASDLADDLKRYIEGQPILARKATVYQRATKWARRHPSATGLLVMTTLVGFAIAGLWWRAEEKGRGEHEQRVRGEQLIYARNIALAEFEYKANKIENCQKLLNDCQPTLRNWEWSYLSNQCEDAVWESPTSSIPAYSVSISRDGSMVASGHADWGIDQKHPIEVWDLNSGRKKWSLEGHPAGVYDVSFSDDGRYLASAGVEWRKTKKGTVKVWDLQDGSSRTLTEDNAYVVRCNPNGGSVYAGMTSGIINEFSLQSGKSIGTFTGLIGFVTDLAFDSSGKFLVATSPNGSLIVWDRATRKVVDSLFDLGDLRRVSWHPDGKTLLVGGYTGNLYRYEWTDHQLKLIHTQAESSVPIIEYSPDGLQLVKAVFGEGAKILDSKTAKIDRVLRRHNGHVNSLSFDEQGMRLATGGNDGAIRVWDLTQSRKNVATYATRPEKIRAMASNPSKPELALAMNAVNGNLGSSQFRIELLDLTSMKSRKALRGHTDFVTSVAYSPSGDRILTGSDDTKVLLWDSNLGKLLSTFSEHKTGIVGVHLIRDQLALSVDREGNVLTWETESNRVVSRWKGSISTVQRMAIDRDGNRLCLLDDKNRVTLWDVSKGVTIGGRVFQHSLAEVKLAPLARQIAIGYATGKIELWDLKSFLDGTITSPTSKITSHTSEITSLDYNPAGDRLVSCSSDESIRLIDCNAGCEVFELDRVKGRAPLAIFSNDGMKITRAEGGNLWHWDVSRKVLQWSNQIDNPTMANWYRSQIDRATFQNALSATEIYRTKLLELEPENYDVYHWRGVIRVKLNNLEGAESDLRKAIAIKTNLLSQYELARVLLMQGKVDEYRQATQQLFSDTAIALRRNENYSMAWICCISPESEIDPKVIRTLLDGSKVVNNPMGAFLKAIPVLEKSIDIPGGEKSVKNFEKSKEFDSRIYALVCYRTGDYALAIKHSQDAAKKVPTEAYIPNLIRSMSLAKSGKIGEAKRILASAVAQRARFLRVEESGIELSSKIVDWNYFEYPLLLAEAERTLSEAQASKTSK